MTTKTLDFNKPITTRSGRPVRILCTDAGGEYPVIGLRQIYGNGREEVCRWKLDGTIRQKDFFVGEHVGSADLINPPPPKVKLERWVNVYVTDGGVFTDGQYLYLSQAKAVEMADHRPGYIGAKLVVIEFPTGE